MQKKLARTIIETVISKTLVELRKNSKRSLRNLVDLGLHYTRGRFIDATFQLVQNMLTDQNNPYYDVVFNLANHVDETMLKNICINVGYSSWTMGARKIREYEESSGHNVPWVIVFRMQGYADVPLTEQEIFELVAQANAMGVYCFVFFCEKMDHMQNTLLRLAQQYRECVFMLYCQPDELQPAFIKSLRASANILPVLEAAADDQRNIEQTVKILRQEQCMFGKAISFDDANVDAIISQYGKTEKHVPCPLIFAMEHPASSPQTAKRMAKFALSLQENPKSPLFFINFYADLVRIDGIISEEQHYLEIAANGEIYTDYKQRIARANVREDHLGTLLLRLMPRTEHKSQSLSRLSTSHVTL